MNQKLFTIIWNRISSHYHSKIENWVSHNDNYNKAAYGYTKEEYDIVNKAYNNNGGIYGDLLKTTAAYKKWKDGII